VNSILRIYATGLGTGFFPIAPGTAGSVLALAVYCWFPGLPLGADGHIGIRSLLLVIALTLVGVAASRRGEEEFGKDGSPIVIDEVIGQWITVMGLVPTPVVIVAGFLLFRLLDIFKPFPAGRSQALPYGWGVMADDVVSGLYGAVILRLLLRVPGVAGL
jgi:phosphatidylglycerophosphatase A